MSDFQEQKLNLKGRTGNLLYYRNIDTGRVEEKVRVVKGQPQTYFTPILDRVYFTEDDVRKFNLDRLGQPLPYMHGHIVMIHEYVYDFWGHYIQAEGLALYGHLLRHCYGDKNWCFPDLPLLAQKMGKSANTVKKYLKILEDYGFVYKFLVQSQKNNRMDESPLYKVRKKVPFLSQDLIDKLPENLKEHHERFMNRLVENFEEIPEFNEETDYSQIYDDLTESGELRKKPVSPMHIQKSEFLKTRELRKSRSEKDIDIWIKVLDTIQHTKNVSKPSFETWFKGSIFLQNGNHFCIYSRTKFASDWLASHYKDLIIESLQECTHFDEDIHTLVFDYMEVAEVQPGEE
ncbi:MULTISPECIES: helix-turn-helix domain-containing protein [Bacillus cereus group]|uniref:helix-turn-helix domain-containing protein n=1 Tax=Bacillus cereus group sp. BfR-BA-01494 TaxID=2920362 RepID=UPI0013809C99|nr:helix-turn-helix domain-containing protein [Bacillus cereus]MEB9561516.1 helix-turn-helix domain-containing protein [Bacillus cereus]MRC02842.1 replication initiation factor RepA [Bacillus thuringiensis]MRC76570.1 replication initiation factor RepA [Bacillus thuringiensis]MRD18483.1 replication initiation factor RepA [Bacillus thuringiensis]